MNKISFKGIVDTTLRDGQQSPLLYDYRKYRFNLEDKMSLIKGMLELGINHIELFSPVVSQIEKNDITQIINFVKKQSKKVRMLAHCRIHEYDIEEAVNIGFDGINLYMGVSTLAQKYKYQKNFSQVKKTINKIIKKTRLIYPDLYIRFSIEDAFRTKLSDIYSIYDDLSPYVNTFGIPDTVGIASPEQVGKTVKLLKLRYPNTDLECHFHNDRGLAIANSLSAIEAGAQFIDASIWGLAERSGITSLTALLLNLDTLKKNLGKPYKLSLCYPINVLMGSILKAQVPYTEPVSLTNRTHIAGVHQKAVVGNNKTYEGINLSKFGVNKNQLLLGPLSGWNLLYYYLTNVENFRLSVRDAKLIASEFKQEVAVITADRNPKDILLAIVERLKFRKKAVPQTYKQKRFENLN